MSVVVVYSEEWLFDPPSPLGRKKTKLWRFCASAGAFARETFTRQWVPERPRPRDRDPTELASGGVLKVLKALKDKGEMVRLEKTQQHPTSISYMWPTCARSMVERTTSETIMTSRHAEEWQPYLSLSQTESSRKRWALTSHQNKIYPALSLNVFSWRVQTYSTCPLSEAACRALKVESALFLSSMCKIAKSVQSLCKHKCKAVLLEVVVVWLLQVKLYWQSFFLPSWPFFLSWKRHFAMLWLRWKAARQRCTFERTIVWRHLLRIIFFQVKYLPNQDSKHMPCHNPRSGRLFLMAGQPDRVMGPQCLHWVWAGCGSGDFFSERHDLAIHGTCADFGSHRIARGFLEDFHLDSLDPFSNYTMRPVSYNET